MYSNCLFEALKAKIKDPKNVHIIYLPKKWNRGNLHFYWIKGEDIFHYTNPKYNRTKILFKGTIKKENFETFEAFILRSLAVSKPFLSKEVVAKKLRFSSTNKKGFLDWATYAPAFDDYDLPEENKISKLIMVKNNSKEIKILKIKDFDKDNYEFVQWKYISPYCQEYRLFSSDEV